MPALLGGLTVLDLSWGLAGALASMFLADYGAEVIKVEPPQGDPLRGQPAFAMWQRGKKSVVLDLKQPGGRETARALARRSDVLLQSYRPGTAERMGLGYGDLCDESPGLIYASITAFGADGPSAYLKGYEGIVAAKLGAFSHAAGMAPRPGPAFAATPYASFGAAQTVLQGILAALYVRGKTGRGQKVEATLAQGLCSPSESAGPGAIVDYLAEKYPERYQKTPTVPVEGSPIGEYVYRLLVAMTKDGRWLQFSQSAPHLWKACIEALDLQQRIDADPAFKDAPRFTTYEDSVRFWDLMLDTVRQKTLAEWREHFKQYPDVGAELFRTPEEAMDHPQMLHNGHVVELVDPRVGKTRQLAPVVKLFRTPVQITAPAPEKGQHTREVLRRLNAGRRDETPPHLPGSLPAHPLEGVTVLELGLFYAAPFGATILADLGARVIKLEPLGGDFFRFTFPIPETGAVKVLQGKESVAVDLAQAEGRKIAHQLAERADLVLMSFRGGAAEVMGVDYETLSRINPNIVYLSAPGYGIDGPYARHPAFAPTIGAGVGGALYQAGPGALPADYDTMTLDEVKALSMRLRAAASSPGNADGVSAQVVGTALLLGLVGRQRTGIAQHMLTSMVCSMSYANSAHMIQYDGKPPRTDPDPELLGFHALYRLYPAAEGWLFLACVQEDEWDALCKAIHDHTGGAVDLASDSRFGTTQDRRLNDTDLAEALSGFFKARTSGEWESAFRPYDIACAEVAAGPLYRAAFRDPIMTENGFVTEVDSPIFGPHPRLTPLARLSLTPGLARPGVTIGQHTEAVLTELGYGQDAIADLERRKVVLRAKKG